MYREGRVMYRSGVMNCKCCGKVDTATHFRTGSDVWEVKTWFWCVDCFRVYHIQKLAPMPSDWNDVLSSYPRGTRSRARVIVHDDAWLNERSAAYAASEFRSGELHVIED